MLQSMEILQMSALELDEYLKNLALENPLVDFSEQFLESQFSAQSDVQRKSEWLESTDYQNKSYYQQERDASDIEKNWYDSRDVEEELSEYLLSQLLMSRHSKLEKMILEEMIFSLDEKGYFLEEISYFSERFHVSDDKVLGLLKEIQGLDPAGVGARSIQECLLLQLERRQTESELAKILVTQYLEEIGKNHIQNIAKKLNCSIDDVLAACEEIRTLNPKPGRSFSNRELMRYVVPDVLVVKFDDRFEILVHEYKHSNFQINTYYQDMLRTTDDKETKKYLQEKLAQAEQVKFGIQSRSSTLSRVMEVLVEKQIDFFNHGIGHKKPLKLIEIAEILGIHESTVSRTLRGKYVQCTWGVFALNYFLTSVAVKASVGVSEMTPEQVKSMIRDIIENEDKGRPLSDQKISELLKQRKADISRRTVNKYRMEMGIPDKSGRKAW